MPQIPSDKAVGKKWIESMCVGCYQHKSHHSDHQDCVKSAWHRDDVTANKTNALQKLFKTSLNTQNQNSQNRKCGS